MLLFIKKSILYYWFDDMYLGLFLDFPFSSISISIPVAYPKIFHHWGPLVFFNIYWEIFFLFKRVFWVILAYLFFHMNFRISLSYSRK